MPRLSPLLAAVAAMVVLLAACDSGSATPNYSSVSPPPSARTSAPPTPSASPSVPTTGPNVSPGEVPPTEPAAATTDDSSGAIAFVGYYIRTLDWVYATSRPDLLTPFYASSCTTCANGRDFISELVATGAIKGGRLELKKIGMVQNDGRSGAQFAISANVAVDAAEVVTTAGATATTFPATADTTLTEWIAWQDGEWTILEERYA